MKCDISIFTEPQNIVCEDVVEVIHDDDCIYVGLTDGAGGSGDGLFAANSFISHFRRIVKYDKEFDPIIELKAIDSMIPSGNCTGIIAKINKRLLKKYHAASHLA